METSIIYGILINEIKSKKLCKELILNFKHKLHKSSKPIRNLFNNNLHENTLLSQILGNLIFDIKTLNQQ